jgi:hypothetical protein
LPPEIVAIFKAAGISRKDLRDPTTAEFAFKFVKAHLDSLDAAKPAISSPEVLPPASRPAPPVVKPVGGTVCGACGGEITGQRWRLVVETHTMSFSFSASNVAGANVCVKCRAESTLVPVSAGRGNRSPGAPVELVRQGSVRQISNIIIFLQTRIF